MGLAAVILAVAGAAVVLWRGRVDPSLVAVVRRGPLNVSLTASGVLRPIQSLTYRSPVAGREIEIIELAPEGTRVNEGDLLVRLDTTDVERESERNRQDLRQAELDREAADGEYDEAEATVKQVAEGEGALTVEEVRTRAQLAQKKVDQLREEYNQLKPLLDRGFITREELSSTSNQLEQAEEELNLAKKRMDVLVDLTHPREKRRAAIQLAQKDSQRGRARARVRELQLRQAQLQQLLEACSIYARSAGLVVYEDYLNASPRRKIRLGDRVTPSQGIITIPEVGRMIVETTIDEAQVHRIKRGQIAQVRVEAYPELRLSGRVLRVGTLASSSIYRPMDANKVFDLTIELDPTDADLRPEMTARADIALGTKDNVLLAPVTAVFDHHGVYVAYVVGAAGPEERRVELGQSNDQFVEIVAGLEEADRVTLLEPAAAGPQPVAPAAAPAASVPSGQPTPAARGLAGLSSHAGQAR